MKTKQNVIKENMRGKRKRIKKDQNGNNALNFSISGQTIQKLRGKINIRRAYFLKNKACRQVTDNSYPQIRKALFFLHRAQKSNYSAFPFLFPFPL